MTTIHPTAIVSENASIGDNVVVGPYSIIEDEVEISDGCEIASHVLISNGTKLGKNCKIYKGAVLGTNPQDLKFDDEKTFLEIGDNTTIREFATLNRATTHSYYTIVGNNCLIMAYAHVAHDCQVGNNVVLANSVTLAGHVIIEDFVGIGGLTPVHQFVRIGTQSFIGGGLRIPKDVPPFILAMGEPLKFAGLNKIGMQRRGFTDEALSAIREAFKIIYRQNNTTKEAVAILSDQFAEVSEVMHLVDFINSSERGIIR